MKTGKNILICPLEWGLGHAARIIPIASKLRAMNQKVYIAAGEEHLKFLRAELPGLTFIDFPGFRPAYSRYFPQYIPLLLSVPALLFHIAREHRRLKRIVKEYSIDIVISDNRFGLWHKKIRTAYITHMPLIPFPRPFRFLEFIGLHLHRAVIRKYSLCLIPDLPGDINLTGRLSHGIMLPGNVRYAGILSRFPVTVQSSGSKLAEVRHNTVILSGPEPQRSVFRKKAINLLANEKILSVILEGNPCRADEIITTGNIASCSNLSSQNMQELICSGEKIITRAGYSTIMELVSLNRSALLFPTPGQTEQEYLAEYLSSKGLFSSFKEEKEDEGSFSESIRNKWYRELNEQSEVLMDNALNELLEYHHND